MYLIPIIRCSRAITACTLFPSHPIEAITTSEIISYTYPFITNSYMSYDILLFMFYYFYDNEYSLQLIREYKEKDILYYQTEICGLLLYLLNYSLNYLN